MTPSSAFANKLLTKAELHHEIDLCQGELTRREQRITELFVKVNGLRQALVDALTMLEASRFGGHRSYRALTPLEEQRLKELEALI
jgi:hypothetical protein